MARRKASGSTRGHLLIFQRVILRCHQSHASRPGERYQPEYSYLKERGVLSIPVSVIGLTQFQLPYLGQGNFIELPILGNEIGKQARDKDHKADHYQGTAQNQ